MAESEEYVEYEKQIGKALFGKYGRMSLGCWIATRSDQEAERLTGANFAQWCVESGRGWPSAMSNDLKLFANLRMIEEVARDRTVYFRRLEHPLWDVYCMIDVVLREVKDPGQRRFYSPTNERIETMISDLVSIHSETQPGTVD